MNNYEKEITELKKKIAEYEAVEQYIMKTIRNGGEYDDILKAHYREGKVIDDEWVDDKEEEDESEDDDDDEEEDDDDDEEDFNNPDNCDVCGSDRGHHDISKRGRLMPCESDDEYEPENQYDSWCDNYCGTQLTEDVSIECLSNEKGEERTYCSCCFETERNYLKSEGWVREGSSEAEEDDE